MRKFVDVLLPLLILAVILAGEDETVAWLAFGLSVVLFLWRLFDAWKKRYGRPFNGKLTLTPLTLAAFTAPDPRLGLVLFNVTRDIAVYEITLSTRGWRTSDTMQNLRKIPIKLLKGQTSEPIHFTLFPYTPGKRVKVSVRIDGINAKPYVLRTRFPHDSNIKFRN